MKITNLDKIKLIGSMYSVLKLLPDFKQKIYFFVKPVDITRFFEFAYIIKFIREKDLRNLNILDVSSPHMIAYYLSKNNNVLKTNIDDNERKFIKENKNLKFKLEDATELSFPDNTFDMTYSISVIEHIYEKYSEAISEMIRVTKKGGYIYLTFPISKEHKEEWLDEKIYSKQKSSGEKNFFQYRFDKNDVTSIINRAKNTKIILKDIFWEKNEGSYDRAMESLRSNFLNKYLKFIKNLFVNYFYGFTMFSREPYCDYAEAKSFGNLHLILQKID